MARRQCLKPGCWRLSEPDSEFCPDHWFLSRARIVEGRMRYVTGGEEQARRMIERAYQETER